MTRPRWVGGGPYLDWEVGDLAYLVEVLDTTSGKTTWHVSKDVPRTNRSREPMPNGWCGETNNRSVYGYGRVEIRRVVDAPGGARVLIRRVKDGKP